MLLALPRKRTSPSTSTFPPASPNLAGEDLVKFEVLIDLRSPLANARVAAVRLSAFFQGRIL